MTVTAEETEATEPELIQGSESQTLPLPAHATEAARLFLTEENDNSESDDIMDIIHSCLKAAKKCDPGHSVKMIWKLTAVLEYVKLRARYRMHKACKRPCLNASVAIARRVGKGPYFARQIRHNELYLRRYHRLPPPKRFARHGHHTLLDNESILHDVRAYLAAQALGTITPRALCKQVNEVILPTLQIHGTISESTAQRWLRFKLGYQCKEVRKGVYVDGHERPDVIKEREEFLDQILNRYEP